MKNLRSSVFWVLVLVAAAWSSTGLHAALVGPGGYTNDFSALPAAADWSFFSIAGGSGDVTTPAGLDTEVQAIAAGTINAPVGTDATDPPAFSATPMWSSSGLYLQTRPTGNRASLLMCTLVNNLGGSAASVTISYSFNKVVVLAEEVEGHRAYYSLTGAANSWINIPEFSSASAGRLSATLNISWANGSPLYIVWADDNGSPSPDTGCQIDNFSATAVSSAGSPSSGRICSGA